MLSSDLLILSVDSDYSRVDGVYALEEILTDFNPTVVSGERLKKLEEQYNVDPD